MVFVIENTKEWKVYIKKRWIKMLLNDGKERSCRELIPEEYERALGI